jgi:cytochrome c oxidase subunit 2
VNRHIVLGVVVPACLALCGCSGLQSALDPAGEEASLIAKLFWSMAFGGLAIWVAVVLLSLYASRWKRRTISDNAAGRLIFWGGVVFPVAVLAALLGYALWLMPALRPFAGVERGGIRIEVVASQFWWRVVYHRGDGRMVVSANEVRLPVGERVEFELASADMIHSFWIPALGGKMDAIPGRTNRLSLLATRPGIYRGQCAEFCGTSHALMAFPAVAMEPADFEAWLDARSRPSPGLDASGEGRALFEREGCGACHRVEGRPAWSDKGPDLSHVGSRLTIAAGQLDNDAETLARFILHAGSVKPRAQMPSYSHLTQAEALSIAIWLKGLQ